MLMWLLGLVISAFCREAGSTNRPLRHTHHRLEDVRRRLLGHVVTVDGRICHFHCHTQQAGQGAHLAQGCVAANCGDEVLVSAVAACNVGVDRRPDLAQLETRSDLRLADLERSTFSAVVSDETSARPS